ncbi:hypothetical protein V2A60_004201 [Cordyceps javanica]
MLLDRSFLALTWVATAAQAAPTADDGASAVAPPNVPPGCERIKDIQLAIQFSNSLWAGSWDMIGATLETSSGTAFLPNAAAPERGSRHVAAVDMQRDFDADEIDVTSIKQITLSDAPALSDWAYELGLYHDQWTLDGVQIMANCSGGGGTKAFYDKYLHLDHDNVYQHSELAEGDTRGVRETVATFNVSLDGWRFSC